MATMLNKRGYTERPGNVTGLVLILVIGAVIIFYVISVTPAERAELGIPGYSKIALDTNPGLISGFAEADVTTFSRKLSQATVKNIPADSTKKLSSSVSVSRSNSVNNDANFEFTAVPSKVSASEIKFKIADKYGSGSLSVKLNGKTVKTIQGSIGETISVILPITAIKETNIITFEVSSPGLAFWQSNSYLLKNVELLLQNYDVGSFTHDFVLTQSELANTGKANLHALINQEGEKTILKISLNGNEIYNGLPEKDFDLSIPIHHFDANNELFWVTERGGKYDIIFPEIEFTFSPENTEKIYRFNVASGEMTAINSNFYECKMTVKRESSFGYANIEVNSNRMRANFNEASIYSSDICQYLQQGTNAVTISSDNDIVISRLQVVIREKQ